MRNGWKKVVPRLRALIDMDLSICQQMRGVVEIGSSRLLKLDFSEDRGFSSLGAIPSRIAQT
jgi:hypothetical protein